MSAQIKKRKIHAPYNFVPLSAWIYQPGWAQQVSRDVPFSDGINGEIKIRIKADSPILVGGKQEPATKQEPGQVFPFQTVEGDYAIPGTSLKGMIRALMSIVSFGKMRQVDDQWLSIRDLTNGAIPVYRDFMTNPGPKAGYLRPVGQGNDFSWEIVPCHFLSVSHGDLVKLGHQLGIADPEKIKDAQSAPSKYELWKLPDEDRQDNDLLNVSYSNDFPKQSRTNIDGEKATGLNSKDSRRRGRLVFTGQPQKNNGSKGCKKREFLFCSPDHDRAVTVDPEVIRAFLHIHGEKEEWKHHIKKVNQQTGVPVFYIKNGDKPSAIGLAYMFRLAYRHSVGKTIDHTYKRHRDSETRDLAELLFGHINENEAGMAGRVSFSMARLLGKPQLEKPIETILNSPKPSYYPSYICQKASVVEGRIAGQAYQTLMDEAEIRGWKRYPARPNKPLQSLTKADNNNDNVKMKLHPLQSGSTFEARVRLHNVRPIELGALLWCLTWGGNTDLRHGLGMGKPLGMGKVSIDVDSHSWNLNRNDGSPVGQAATFIEDFEQLMDEQYRAAAMEQSGKCGQGWRDSEQMVQLLAMANPTCAPGKPGNLEYMDLPKHLDMKKKFQYLMPYADFRGLPDEEVFPKRRQRDRDAFETILKRKREAEEAARKREEALAHLPELEREVLKDLQQEVLQKAEEKAYDWLKHMDIRADKEAVQVARALRTFYRKINKWEGKQSKKQTPKIAKVKQVLARFGGDHVPE